MASTVQVKSSNRFAFRSKCPVLDDFSVAMLHSEMKKACEPLMQPHLLKAVLFEMWKNSCAVAEMGRRGSKVLLFHVM